MNGIKDLMSFAVGGFTLGHIFSALVILLVCLLVVRLLLRLVNRLLERTRLETRVKKYISLGVKSVLYILTILVVTSSLGVDMTSLVALLSVGSLGITLAAEDILSNIAGGIVILSSHPFQIGDFIEAAGVSGTVKEISLNHTRLETPDGQLVLLPNKTLSTAQMTNYTVLGCRRVNQTVAVSYDASADTVRTACLEAVAKVSLALQEPAPLVHLSKYGESAVEFTVRCWTKPENYWDVYFALAEELRKALEAHGVQMTYPHLNVHIVEK